MIRLATIEEREQVERMSQQDKAVKDFKFMWSRWEHWETEHFPVVATDYLEDKILVGFHAVVFNKRGDYVNSYYQYTAPTHRGQGLGAAMVDFILQRSHKAPNHYQRLKFQVPMSSDGERFWTGFGLRPFGRSKDHLYFDVNIATCYSVEDLKQLTVEEFSWDSIPESSKKRYLSNNLTLFKTTEPK